MCTVPSSLVHRHVPDGSGGPEPAGVAAVVLRYGFELESPGCN